MSYTRKKWEDGHVITADGLNNLEQGVSEAHAAAVANAEKIKKEIEDRTEETALLIARMNVFSSLPEGSTLSDAEVADIRVGPNGETYDTAGEAVRGQIAEIRDTYAVKDNLSTLTDGHFKEIPYSFNRMGNYYQEVDGVISIRGKRPSSGIIAAPKNLCLDFGIGGGSDCFLYFYTKNEIGEYTLTFDIFNNTVNGLKNFTSVSRVPMCIIHNIPDNTYMEICKDNGIVGLYDWDGEPFGMDVSATCSIPTTDPTEAWMFVNGDSGITVHGKAKYIVSESADMKIIYAYKNGERTQINGSAKRFFKFPSGYDWFRIRIETKGGEGTAQTLSGDVREIFHIAADVSEEIPISNAVKVIENCKRVCSLSWSPKKNIVVNSNTQIDFKPNVKYNGLLYSSQWDRAHFVGWHISPHTFINAANDENSILYSEKADNGEGVTSPIYGTVCSAFATMCDGWDHPQTNAGFFYDPDIEKYYAHKPQLGQIYTDIVSHCVIPSGSTKIGNDTIISAYESFRPISAKTCRIMSMTYSDVWEWWNAAAGLDYYNLYGYVIHNPRAKADMSAAPYADFSNAVIINGSARPHKGDKSVYTSVREDPVIINIKNESATTLYLESESGAVQQIKISGASIDVKPYLTADGVYYVYTNADSTKESFEYVTVTTVPYTLKNNSLTFGNNDFWYADCTFAGIHFYQNGVDENGEPTYQTRNCSVPANAKGDYSKWFTRGNRITSVNAIFKKGRYGAYTVPISK